MNVLDRTLTHAIPRLAIYWLRKELAAREVCVRLTDSCLREFVHDAEAGAWTQATGSAEASYLTYLRNEVAVRAEFLRVWTSSDDSIEIENEDCERFVKLARKYALPQRAGVPILG
jgi:hypothetical protein